MNGLTNVPSPTRAVGLCIAGAACATGAYVAGTSLAALVAGTYDTAFVQAFAASWEPIGDRLLLYLWSGGHELARDLAGAACALWMLWVVERRPVVSLPIQRVEPLEDEFE